MSAKPFKIKYSNSLIKRPLPPISDKDLFKIASHEIHQTKVIMTIFNGKIVYNNNI